MLTSRSSHNEDLLARELLGVLDLVGHGGGIGSLNGNGTTVCFFDGSAFQVIDRAM